MFNLRKAKKIYNEVGFLNSLNSFSSLFLITLYYAFNEYEHFDILKETINVLKKDPGNDQSALCNREKAVIIDALKTKYSLPLLLRKMQLSKSSYYYQKK